MKRHHKRLRDILQKCYDDMQREFDAMTPEQYEDGVCDGMLTPLQGNIDAAVDELETGA